MKQKNEKLDLPRSKENIENYFQTKFILHILRNPIYIKLNDVELDLTKRPLINKPTELDLHLLNFNRIVEFENIKDDIYRIVIECIDYDKDPNTYNIEVETEINPNSYYTFLDIEKKRLINIVNESKNIRLINIIQNCIDFIEKELEEYKEVKAKETFTIKECALAYIFDTWATGNTIPLKHNGTKDKKAIIEQAKYYTDKKGEAFYNNVIDLLKSDLNNGKILNSTFNNYAYVLKNKCKNWKEVEQYLKKKRLF